MLESAVLVKYKPPALKALETLSDTHRAWLEHLYDDSHDPKLTAKAFGVTPQAVCYVRDSPAGQAYAIRKAGGDKAAMNLFAAKIILDRLSAQRTVVPLDVVIKIYTATLPKEAPSGKMDEMIDYAERIANQLGLEDDDREKVLEFVRNGGELQ